MSDDAGRQVCIEANLDHYRDNVEELVARESPSIEAYAAARTLLDGYWHQDRRMADILRGDYQRAAWSEETALEKMGAAFEWEFRPQVPSADARRAGVQFMTALFVQDELENAAELRQTDSWLSRYQTRIDPEDVRCEETPYSRTRVSLRKVCELVGIDPAYAESMMEFFNAHDRENDAYVTKALEAHTIRLRSSIENDVSPGVVDDLAEYFVTASKMHDRWKQAARGETFDRTVDLVAVHYSQLRDLQPGGAAAGPGSATGPLRYAAMDKTIGATAADEYAAMTAACRSSSAGNSPPMIAPAVVAAAKSRATVEDLLAWADASGITMDTIEQTTATLEDIGLVRATGDRLELGITADASPYRIASLLTEGDT